MLTLCSWRQPRGGNLALAPVGGAGAPHCSIPAASRAELASCRSPSAASRSERQRGDPGRSASACRRSHPRSQPSGWETPPADCAAQRGRVSGPGDRLPNLPGDRSSPGPGECEQDTCCFLSNAIARGLLQSSSSPCVLRCDKMRDNSCSAVDNTQGNGYVRGLDIPRNDVRLPEK
ncbi:hypothetical protein E5288_WYG013807 [Bos mutus]|uniref:Uncharacterized protein n=1 Tax=Bos mutus TaxID=72004 RepID=A0A6B0QTI2_9CETA|nr:hypothetical protein [Bos mutus]